MTGASFNTRPTEKWRKIKGVVRGEIQWLTHEALIEFVYLHHFRCVHNKMYVLPMYLFYTKRYFIQGMQNCFLEFGT